MRMNLQEIQFVLADQREYCAHLLSLATCARVEETLMNLNSKLAQVCYRGSTFGQIYNVSERP